MPPHATRALAYYSLGVLRIRFARAWAHAPPLLLHDRTPAAAPIAYLAGCTCLVALYGMQGIDAWRLRLGGAVLTGDATNEAATFTEVSMEG